MELSEAIEKINYELCCCTGEQLGPAQEVVITAAWVDQSYEEAALSSDYSYLYLQRHVGPKLWAALSATYGQKVTKKSYVPLLKINLLVLYPNNKKLSLMLKLKVLLTQ